MRVVPQEVMGRQERVGHLVSQVVQELPVQAVRVALREQVVLVLLVQAVPLEL